MGKEYGGVPLWMWLAGGGVVILGYLYIRSRQSGSGQGGQGGQSSGAGKYTSTSHMTLQETIKDLHSAPAPHAKQGPERQWLIAKTGSQRPWTFLAAHDERVQVGPHGSRTIVPKGR